MCRVIDTYPLSVVVYKFDFIEVKLEKFKLFAEGMTSDFRQEQPYRSGLFLLCFLFALTSILMDLHWLQLTQDL